jgi:primosomal protein N' (replication factor Y)
VPTKALETHFDYRIPEQLDDVVVGSCVLVDFANRPAVGYVVGLADHTSLPRLKEIRAVLGGPYFGPESAETARWIASEYLCPVSEAVRLFTPPGGTPSVVRSAGTGDEWVLRRAGVGPVDDRWAELVSGAGTFTPRANAITQRAVLDALSAGPVRVAELHADLGSVDAALRSLERVGAVRIDRRRRQRDGRAATRPAPRHAHLTRGQRRALETIDSAMSSAGGVVVLDGVTGSGKTEVYLRAIERALTRGGTACVLVPEISLTPQTVGRFRSRFGDDVAVLHSRLSAGERYDQWDLVRQKKARIVVGARSALFAPLSNLSLIVIDEEHESSYKQSSAPRYHAREVAAHLARLHNATLVLGSASLSMEARQKAHDGEWQLVELPERVHGRPMPPVTVVDMAAEFAAGHRSMFSRGLAAALGQVRDREEKAVLLLNRRGFASFLLCRECGFVPRCSSCSTSLTFHEVGARLMCHHCGLTRPVPPTCPECDSPYLRQFGAGTQRVEAELAAMLVDWPVVRMDSDTTRGKGAHERLLASFESLRSGVLLGTQMIAKGLDFPEVTLVGVISADITLNIPDFRAGERTYQLLEQVAGRAGRGERAGQVFLQTYWPDHPALRAAATHDASIFYTQELATRRELAYPPFGRLANVLVWGRERDEVARYAAVAAAAIVDGVPEQWAVLGPSPAPLSRLKGVWRWHVLVKAPVGAPLPGSIGAALASTSAPRGVTCAVDIDPVDML